jgi:hypothetical protein
MKAHAVLLAGILTAFLGVAAAADTSLSAADQVAQMKRGVNIVGYDPLWRDPAKAASSRGISRSSRTAASTRFASTCTASDR